MKRRLLAAVVLVVATSASATDYYVSPSGSGSLCTSGSPCALAQINATDLNGGDNVILSAGTHYGRLTLTSQDSGSTDSWVTIRGAGRDTTIITGANATDVVDANAVSCAADACGFGDLPNVYRIPYGTAPALDQVWETNWILGRVHVYDGGPYYRFEHPVGYRNLGSATAVNGLQGSYFYSGGNLYVHTYESSNPATAGLDLKVSTVTSSTGIIEVANGTNWIRFEDFSVLYGAFGFRFYEDIDRVWVEDVLIGSQTEYGFVTVSSGNGTAMTNFTIRRLYISSVHRRPDTTSGNAHEGWGAGASGEGMSVVIPSGNLTPASGWDIDGLDIHSIWNGLKFGQLQNSRINDVFIEGSANHLWRIDECTRSTDWTGVNVTGLIILNGQDTINTRCGTVPPKFSRSAFGFLGLASDLGTLNGMTILGSLFGEYGYGNATPDNVIQRMGVTSFWRSNYNWIPSNGDDCVWPGGAGCTGGQSANECACGPTAAGEWTQACVASDAPECDVNSVFATSVTLAGTTWPTVRSNGTIFTQDALTRADFYPVAGSPLIDAGNPDIDMDGVLETACAPRGDDCCDAANHCYGSAPDIGPFEWGIDVGAPAAASSIQGGTIRGGSIR